MLDGALRLALPPRCPGCGTVVETDHRFCPACWDSLHFLAPPWCAGCCLPFDYDRGPDARCARCIAEPPRHSGIRAAVAYGDVARRMVLRLKHGGRSAFAETAARAMLRLMPGDAELIVPVPLHRWRIWHRGYNQAALIGAALGRLSGVEQNVHALVRHRATPMLRGLGERERRRAVRAAFGVASAAAVRGRAIVLVDDVYTSGATTDACVGVLLRAGARMVTVMCWARVIADARD